MKPKLESPFDILITSVSVSIVQNDLQVLLEIDQYLFEISMLSSFSSGFEDLGARCTEELEQEEICQVLYFFIFIFFFFSCVRCLWRIRMRTVIQVAGWLRRG